MKKNLKRKINFKRGIGGDGGWGAGMDYLVKRYWNELDKLVEDNYYGRHNIKLINFLSSALKKALKEAFFEMKKFSTSDKDKKLFKDWVKKLNIVKKIGKSVKNSEEKVIFIDVATQFLRESSLKGSGASRKQKKYFYKKRKSKKEFKGLVAAKTGLKKIKGRVKIILSRKDFDKFKKGNILVSDETDVTFLPLMRLSKAIITNEGGLLCHAAITARELKKPCIVGTKIATMALRDGDLIELDISSGKIKILY